MILKPLLNNRMVRMIIIKTLNNKAEIINVFDDMIAHMLDNKNFNPVVTELFIRGRKLNIYLGFITQPNFSVPKNIRLNLLTTSL